MAIVIDKKAAGNLTSAAATSAVAATKDVFVIADGETGGPLAEALRAAGRTVVAVGDENEAWARLGMVTPEAIVLATTLDDGSGWSLCNRIRKHKRLQAVFLLIVGSAAEAKALKQHETLATRADVYLAGGAVEDIVATVEHRGVPPPPPQEA